MTVEADQAPDESSQHAGSKPLGEMDTPMETDETQAEPEPMETDQADQPDENEVAHEVYPHLANDAVKILYSMSQKIAANCRRVEQSRLQYMFDDPHGWGNYHLPLVRDMTRENADIRRSLLDRHVITNEDSAIGQFMRLKNRGFEYMYHWCFQYHAEGPEKKRAGSSS